MPSRFPISASPEAVTAKATVAAMRSLSSLSEMVSALASGASSPRPATSRMRDGGSTANIATSEAPNSAKTR